MHEIESLNPHAVIASHKRPGSADNPTIIEQTTSAQELYDKMLELYPNRVNPGWVLWSSARAVKQ
jgi:hypothetical protein